MHSRHVLSIVLPLAFSEPFRDRPLQSSTRRLLRMSNIAHVNSKYKRGLRSIGVSCINVAPTAEYLARGNMGDPTVISRYAEGIKLQVERHKSKDTERADGKSMIYSLFMRETQMICLLATNSTLKKLNAAASSIPNLMPARSKSIFLRCVFINIDPPLHPPCP
jgi:hypothetical protein